MENLPRRTVRAEMRELFELSDLAEWNVRAVDLGRAGAEHVERRLRRARIGDGLNLRLADCEVSEAMTLASLEESELPEFSTARDRAAADVKSATRQLISRWIEASSPDRYRFEAFEDTIKRRSDPVADEPDEVFFGDTPFVLLPDPRSSADPAEFLVSIGNFEDIGFLCETAPWRLDESELKAEDVDRIADGAVAAIVNAWDNCGVIVALIGNGSTRSD